MKLKKSKKLKEKEAKLAEIRIYTHVCCDGYIRVLTTKRSFSELRERPNRKFRRRFEVFYWNKEEKLRNEFQNDIKIAYGRKAIINNKYVKVDGKWVYERLIDMGAGKSRTWKVNKNILFSPPEIKKELIRVLIDDEGGVTKYGAIRIRSVNLKGMKQVLMMLKSLGIQAHITPRKGKYKDDTIYLAINKKDIPLLLKKIGYPLHPEKEEKLKLIFRTESC